MRLIRWIAPILLVHSMTAWADPGTDELTRARQQAFNERRKEEQIQMLRLDLEKLKLEVETRKALAEMGLTNASTLNIEIPRESIQLKNVTISEGAAKATLDVGTKRVTVINGDNAGSYRVKAIGVSDVILADEQGNIKKLVLNQ